MINFEFSFPIDLCNNPQTKEPKLVAARRIVKEWTGYDDEMAKLAEEIKQNASEKSVKTTQDTHTHTELWFFFLSSDIFKFHTTTHFSSSLNSTM